MKRLFWLGVGATIGVYVLRKATRTAEAFTPSRVAATLAGLGEVVRDFVADVQTAMAEHEQELLAALGVDENGSVTQTPSATQAPPAAPPTSAGRR